MGIDDVLGSIGDGIGQLQKWSDKVNRWTVPEGLRNEPLVDFRGGDGAKINTPFTGGGTAGQQAAAPGEMPKSLEVTLQGMRWLYSNGVSQPIATAALVGKMNRGENDAFGGDYFNTASWGRAWDAANHISPGQAIFLTPDEAEEAIRSPLLYYKPPEGYLPPGFNKLDEQQQQAVLKEAGMPVVGNAYVEKRRENSGWFKYGTGAIDFASVVFLDPTTLALQGVGRARQLANTKTRPKGGWSSAEIDNIMSNPQMEALRKGIWENRANPQLVNNTQLAQRSGMGPRFGAIVSHLADEEELNLFIRTGMGDMRAMDELRLRNAQIESRMASDLSRLGGLDLMRARYNDFPQMRQMVDLEMTRVTNARAADSVLVNRYDEILRQSDLLDELNISRWSMQRAQDRTIAQNQYQAGPARGVVSGAVRGRGRAVTLRPTAPPVSSTRYAPTPIDSGYVHHRMWGMGDFWTGPVTMVRSLKNMKPNGFMDIGSLNKESIVELRGHLARIPNMRESTRADILNKYLKATTEAERKDLLEDVGRIGAAKVAERYGLTPEMGEALYRQHTKLKQGALDDMKRYSAALRSPEDVAAGQQLHIDEFTAEGGKITLSPFTVTRLMNGHTFQDLDALGKILSRHSGRLQTLHAAGGSVDDALKGFADYSTYLWKFTTLFRLGYIPRVLGDDLASQWARLGGMAMTQRGIRGIRNAFDNGARWAARPALQAREANARAGAAYVEEEMALLTPDIRKWEGRIATEAQMRQRDLTLSQQRLTRAEARLQNMDPNATPAQRAALQTFTQGKRNEVARAQQRASAPLWPQRQQMLSDMQGRRDFLQRYHDLQSRAADDYLAQQQKVIQGNQAFDIDGQTFPAAFGGKDGEYHYAQISADETVGNIFNTNKQIIQGNLERSFDHGAKPISAAQDPAEHLKAWTHAINNQIMQDQLSAMAVRGASVDDMVRWLRHDPRGMSYRARLPKMIDTEDIAQSVKYEVDQYLHTPELRMKAMEPDGVSPEWLDRAFPQLGDRPDVHIGQVGNAQLAHANALDRVIQKWFKVAATIPANRMSRHPLFNQFYEGHAKTIVAQRNRQLTERYGQGAVSTMRWTVEDIEKMAGSARQLALRDTRSLVFDIAHRSDAAAATRFMSPFFAATSESFQRWGRVIANKPQVVGYAGNWYNAPLYRGNMQDLDGNQVDQYGYTHIPVYPLNPDGSVNYNAKPRVEKRQVPKSERYIVTRVPKWVADSPLGKAFNITEAGGKLALSQNSMNMVTQGDPWFNPGLGPIVQIPVNEWVKDKPRAAEMARELSILPFGPQGGTAFGENPFGRAVSMAAPKTVRDFITAFDTSDDRYQQVKLQITQRELFLFEQREGRKPTAKEVGALSGGIANKTRNYWMFSASSAFLQPVATQRKDPYQFYRDQYNALRRQNPLTADDEFLGRYGESYFIFAQEASRSEGVPPTMRAVKLQQEYGDLINANPELAALVIGPDGNGPFSREAYAYQLNNPLVPGGAEMMRTRLSATEAMAENQRRLGWAKYTARMNGLTAKLHTAGFKSFADEGAEAFAQEKKAWTSLYAEPLYPDGSENPYYNEEWSKDFFTQDRRKYDRLIPGLTAVANSRLADLSQRSDLRSLQQYLGGRKALVQMLNERKAAGEPSTLAAEANLDLRAQWLTFVDGLVEKDTRFGDLYHRYLGRDMGVDVEDETEEE